MQSTQTSSSSRSCVEPPTDVTATVLSEPLSQHSRMVQRLRRRYPEELRLLPDGTPTLEGLEATLAALQARGLGLGAALRVLRQLVMERLVVLDCEAQASLETITHTVTLLGEFALDQALQQARRSLNELHGPPLVAAASSAATDAAKEAQLWIIGMGKFGARELNVSSDIDLIYVYDHDGETAGNARGRSRISNQEYFGKVVRHVQQLIGEVTEHGFVFRVDLALRPNGNSGPATVSLAALEEYFQVQGREWERFAWLKSRVVAPMRGEGRQQAHALRQVVLPFVFRKYLDYNVFESLRVLHKQIRDHASKRAAGHPERANDVKLSRGGIREIEFTVQLLQVVRGGQFPELRTRSTLEALPRLSKANLMSGSTSEALAAAYRFLRQVEHRIQYLDDQQTHLLPTRDDDVAWIAATMGFEGVCPFLHTLDSHRETVAHEFDTLLGKPQAECKGKGCTGAAQASGPSDWVNDLNELAKSAPSSLAQRLSDWREHPRVLALRDDARTRLVRLLQRTLSWVEQERVTEEAALRMMDWLEPLLRRESYLALLQERPAIHERLLRLLGAARWPARYLMVHPGVIDELASQQLMTERFDAVQFEQELYARKQALRSTGEDDEENLLNLLRRAHHAEVFRTLARDVEGVLTVEQVADDLSALADTVLRVTTQWCWERLKKRHTDQLGIGIIAYGKLGGKELGYGSDLDIVFVYDDEHPDAPDTYSALVRKTINWLTVRTGEGDLYEIDTALRPNGNSGLLVTRFEAYAAYQQGRGSNTAWTWEHQAITRARFVMGGADLSARFDAVRQAVITSPRDTAALAQEIKAMRERVAGAHPIKAEQFDVKHSPGGMVDAEFAVQLLVLTHSRSHPALQDNVGNIALLQRAEAAGLLPPTWGEEAASAYRRLRQVQHRARLDERPTQTAAVELRAPAHAIERVWQHLFPSS